MRKIAALLFLISLTGPVQAHGLSEAGDKPIWTFDPWIVTPLLTFCAAYGIGLLALYRRGRRVIVGHAWRELACLAG